MWWRARAGESGVHVLACWRARTAFNGMRRQRAVVESKVRRVAGGDACAADGTQRAIWLSGQAVA